jgi:hypothetical protein
VQLRLLLAQKPFALAASNTFGSAADAPDRPFGGSKIEQFKTAHWQQAGQQLFSVFC